MSAQTATPPILMLLTGAMGSGKSFGSAYLERTYGATRWSRTELMKRLAHSLADHVGEPNSIMEVLFPDETERDHVLADLLDYVSTYQEEPGKPRRLYQDITQICQDHDPLCFERELAERIDAVGNVPFSLIDDVRSSDAFDFFSERGYVTVRVDATEAVRRERMLARDGYLPSEDTFNHPSETQLNDVPHDYVVHNNYEDATELYQEFDELIAELRQPVSAN